MKNLFVGNLPFSSTEDAVRAHFAQFGEVQQVRIMTDRDTGKPRGFAFVQMTNDEEALKAVAENTLGFPEHRFNQGDFRDRRLGVQLPGPARDGHGLIGHAFEVCA